MESVIKHPHSCFWFYWLFIFLFLTHYIHLDTGEFHWGFFFFSPKNKLLVFLLFLSVFFLLSVLFISDSIFFVLSLTSICLVSCLSGSVIYSWFSDLEFPLSGSVDFCVFPPSPVFAVILYVSEHCILFSWFSCLFTNVLFSPYDFVVFLVLFL